MKRKLTPKDFVGLPFKKRGRANVAKRKTKVPPLLKEWTIQVRAAVPPKHLALMKMAVVRAARHVQAAAILCSASGTRTPEVVAYTDDFFLGHEDIAVPPPRKRRSAR